MEFRETIDKLKAELMDNGKLAIFLGNQSDMTLRVVHRVSGELIELIEEEKEIIFDEEFSMLLERVNRNMLLEVSLKESDELTRDFLIQYSLLIYNWGNAVEDESAKRSAKSIKIIVENLNTLEGMIAISRNLIRYAKQFDSFNPAAFRVSQMYLDKIYSDLEEGEDLNDRNK